MCMYILKYIYISISTYVSVYMFINIHIYVNIYTYIYVYINICVYTHIYVCNASVSEKGAKRVGQTRRSDRRKQGLGLAQGPRGVSVVL